MRVSYHSIDRIRDVRPCTECNGSMDDISDVKAYEGYGPRTYRYQKCQSCGRIEIYPPDQRGYPGDAARFEPYPSV